MPYADANGIRIYYESSGKGHPVILIGGLGSQSSSWAAQVPLYSRHFRVVVFDNRGAGRSDKPEGPYSIEQMAVDTAMLMEALGIDAAHVVGKSMGGMIAQHLAARYPEKVTKLVLACTSARRDEVGDEILRLGREMAVKMGMKAVWMSALFWGYSREYIERNLGAIREALGTVDESQESVRGYLFQNMACQMHNATDVVSSIVAPTLVMLGRRDLIVNPRLSRELASLIKGAKLVEFEDAGHGFWRERQAEVDSEVLKFLLS